MRDALSILKQTELRIAGAVSESIVDGPGIRYVIFTQGCKLRCQGCHNPQSQPLDGGLVVKLDVLYKEIKADPLLSGVTFSGGEPFLQAQSLAILARILKDEGYSLWAYSGYVFEKIKADNFCWDLLRYLDVLVDGPFVLSRQTMDIDFRGSDNQRLIDVQQSLKSGQTILLQGYR